MWYPSPAASRHPLPSGEGFTRNISGINLPRRNVLLELLIPHHEDPLFDLMLKRIHRPGRRPLQHPALGIKCAFVPRTFEYSQILLPVIDGVVQMRTNSAENRNRSIRITADPDRPLHLLIEPASVSRYRDESGLKLAYWKILNVSHRHPFIDRAFPSKRKVTHCQ